MQTGCIIALIVGFDNPFLITAPGQEFLSKTESGNFDRSGGLILCKYPGVNWPFPGDQLFGAEPQLDFLLAVFRAI